MHGAPGDTHGEEIPESIIWSIRKVLAASAASNRTHPRIPHASFRRRSQMTPSLDIRVVVITQQVEVQLFRGPLRLAVGRVPTCRLQGPAWRNEHTKTPAFAGQSRDYLMSVHDICNIAPSPLCPACLHAASCTRDDGPSAFVYNPLRPRFLTQTCLVILYQTH